MEIKKLCDEVYEEVVAIRRKMHRHPEVGIHCPETIDMICGYLDRLGIEYRRLEDRGVIADIVGRPSDKIIMFRADMDALNIKEETGLEFSSELEGKMHACGHDLHIAMLLGSANILSKNKDEFAGTVRLLFQTGEEISGGAKFLIENGALDGVSMGFGIHVDPLSRSHTIGSRIGPDWAGVDEFTITINGDSGHGAMPHKTNDATVAAASIIMNLQTMVSRKCNPLLPLVVTIGEVHSGSAYNIISGQAILRGTCRSFDKEVYDMIPETLRNISENIAEALGCKANIEFKRSALPLINDEKAFNILKESAYKVLDSKDDFFISEMAMIGEDFSEYAKVIPCVFGHLGASGGYPLHNCHINFDEETMKTGMAIEVQFALDALNN